jgi:ceramide glucosyltransferase
MFLLEPLNGPLVPFAALALPVLSGAAPAAALIALPVLWYLPEWALARAGGWRFGGIDLCAAVIRDALLPALWWASLGRQGFDWRGTAMAAPEARNDAMPTV